MPWFLPGTARDPGPAIGGIMNGIAGATNRDRRNRAVAGRGPFEHDTHLAHCHGAESGTAMIIERRSHGGRQADDAFGRNDNLHRGALTLDAVQREAAAMQFDQPLRQRQSEPGPLRDP